MRTVKQYGAPASPHHEHRPVGQVDHLVRDAAVMRALWRVLALVWVPGSIHYVVLPGLRRDELLGRPGVLADAPAAWWRSALAS